TARNPCQVLACRNGVSIFLGGRWIRIIPRGVVMSTIRGDEANEPTADNAPPRLPDGKLCYYVIFDNKTATAVEDRVGRYDEDKPKPKKERTGRVQLGQIASSCRLQIELIAVWDPAIAVLPLVDIADPGKWHVEAGHKNPVGG